jgi:DNA-binding transcriptional regulator LsrR (DeoR family)
MPERTTEDELVQAAQGLGQEEFSRAELANHLGVRHAQIREAFKAARKSGKLVKSRQDEDGTKYFRLAE